MPGDVKIPSFTAHGGRYRAPVALDEVDARAVVALAEADGVTPSTMLRTLIRRALGRRKGRK
jgi:hypothetical protein